MKQGLRKESKNRSPALVRSVKFALLRKISPLAVVDKRAEIAEDVEVGPFCVIGPNVNIGRGCRLLNHVSILGHTTDRQEQRLLSQFCVIGGHAAGFEISRADHATGDRQRERHPRSGDDPHRHGNRRRRDASRRQNLFMVNAHIGHDGNIGSHCIIANNVMLAGHVAIGDHASLMGGVGIHHFVTVGEYSYLAGCAQITHDVPPFVKVSDCDQIRGLNTVGLKLRWHFRCRHRSIGAGGSAAFLRASQTVLTCPGGFRYGERDQPAGQTPGRIPPPPQRRPPRPISRSHAAKLNPWPIFCRGRSLIVKAPSHPISADHPHLNRTEPRWSRIHSPAAARRCRSGATIPVAGRR